MRDGFNPAAPFGDVAASRFATPGSAPPPSTPTDISCALGTVSVNGLLATITAATYINCAIGQVSVDGLLADIGQGITINASTGDVSVDGLPASISAPLVIQCAIGTVSVDGLVFSVNVPATEGVECAPSYIGTTDLIPLYDVGDIAEAVATFTDTDTGDLVDPNNLQLRIRNPAGVISNVTPSRLSLGVYRYDVTATLSGMWRLTWTGANVSEEAQFVVTSSLSDAT